MVNIEDTSTVTIIDYFGNGGKVVVPETINGYKVTYIHFDTFYKCDKR